MILVFAKCVLLSCDWSNINKPYKVSSENILYKCGWSPFLNTTFNSSINTTIVNGYIVYQDSIIQENIPFGKQIEFSR